MQSDKETAKLRSYNIVSILTIVKLANFRLKIESKINKRTKR